MEIKESKSNLFWAITSTVLNVLMGVLVLPILLIKLDQNDIAIWYVFAAIQSFLYILDYSFAPSISRNVTYAFSGASKLQKDSMDVNYAGTSPNIELLTDILFSVKKVYRYVSLGIACFLILIGLPYYISILPNQNISYYLTFAIFFIAMIVNLYFSYLSPYMRGIGAVKDSFKAYSYSRVIYILTATILLLLDFGLIGVMIALFLSGLSLRLLLTYYFKKHLKLININLLNKIKNHNVFSIMFYNIKKEILITLSNFISSQMTTFFCVRYYGLEVSAKYGLSIQVITLLASLSFIYYTINTPRISQARVNKDNEMARKLFLKSYAFNFIGFLSGIPVIVFFGPLVLELIKSNTTLLPRLPLILFSLYSFIQQNYHLCASYIATTNKLPYTYPYIISAIFIIIGYVVIPKIFNTEIYIYAVICIVVQLFYNAWKWPLFVSKELDLNCALFPVEGFKIWFVDIFNR